MSPFFISLLDSLSSITQVGRLEPFVYVLTTAPRLHTAAESLPSTAMRQFIWEDP